jgi:hypothetical protein
MTTDKKEIPKHGTNVVQQFHSKHGTKCSSTVPFNPN